MRFFLLSLAGWVALLSPAGAGWQSEVEALRPGTFPPPPDVTVRYVFGWSGLVAARAEIKLQAGPRGVWSGRVRAGTEGWVRALWKLDATYNTSVATEDWQSLDFTLIESYRRYEVEEKVVFRSGGGRSWRESKSKGAKPPKWKNFYVAGLRDMAGAILLARSQLLQDGDRIKLAVFPGDGMYLVEVRVEGREKLRWGGGDHPVIRLSLHIDQIKKDYSLSPHTKFRHGTVWVSDDELRLPLRLEVGVFVGYVFAEMEAVETR